MLFLMIWISIIWYINVKDLMQMSRICNIFPEQFPWHFLFCETLWNNKADITTSSQLHHNFITTIERASFWIDPLLLWMYVDRHSGAYLLLNVRSAWWHRCQGFQEGRAVKQRSVGDREISSDGHQHSWRCGWICLWWLPNQRKWAFPSFSSFPR